MLRSFSLPLLVAASSILWAGPAPAQDTAVDEIALLRMEAKGDLEGARKGYLGALTALIGEEAAASGEGAALAEHLLCRYLGLVRRGSAYGEAFENLGDLWKRRGIDPVLRGRVGLGLADAALHLGREEDARGLSGELGFVSDWLVCGPFDNEKGGGFQAAYPPEEEFRRDGVYEGKKREVHWVPLPATDPLSWVDLDAILRPNDECLAYATTFVLTAGEQPAAIRVGSDEGLKVWVNGRLVLERDVHRKAHPDQDVVGVVFREGWNQILLKVAERKDDWKFALRITGPEGDPIPALEVSTEPGPLVEVGEEGPAALSPGLGAIGLWTEDLLQEEEEGDPLALFRLAHLYLVRQPGGEEDHTDRDLLQRARRLDPENPIYPYFHALSYREDIEYSIAKDRNLEREALEEAVKLDPNHVLAAHALADYYYRSLGNRRKAESWVRRAIEPNPRFQEARLLLASLLEARGWEEEARRERQAVIEETGETLASLSALARSLGADREVGPAREALRRAHEIDRMNRGIRARLVGACRSAGEPEEAIAILRDALRLEPLAIGPRRQVSKLLDGLDDLDGAIAALREGIEIAPEDDDLLEELGHLLARKGDAEGAERVWQRALELNPNRVALRRYLEFRSEEERPFEEEFPFDTKPLTDRARSEPEKGNEPYRVVLRRELVRVNSDGTRDEFHQEILKIGNDDGARAFDTYRIPFSTGEQQVKVRLARVIHPDGSTEEADIGREMRSRRVGEFSTWSSESVDLPPLAPGDLVEVRYRRDDLEQSFFGDYFGDVFRFQDRVPVAHAAYTLIAPRDRKFYVHVKSASITPRVEDGEGGTVVTTWEMEDVPKLEAEAGRPPARESSPQVEISTFEAWEELGRWYGNLIRSQHEANDPIREKVAELTKGKETVEEKVRAIYDFVVTEVRYNDAWEFGVHGYKPYKAATIFTRRFGDCKDKSILLNTMLREIGVEAHPVLIFATGRRGEEDLKLPMFNHFNHCISYVTLPEREEGIFLDGTAIYHPWTVTPDSDQGAKVLIVREGGGAVADVPETPASENRMSSRREVTLSADGSARIRVESEARGSYGVMLRAFLPIEERRKEELERIYADALPGTEVTSTAFDDLRLLEDPVRIRYEMSSPAFVRETPQGSALPALDNFLFPYAYASTLSSLASLAERKTDLLLPPPTEIVDETVIDLPERTEVVTLPQDREVSSAFGSYTATARGEDGKIRLSRTLTLHPRRVEVEEYEKFRKFCNEVDRARREQVIVHLREGAAR